VTGDAALTDAYTGLVPADLVLACGVFGNVSAQDIEQTIRCCAWLCAERGTVVWTRGRPGLGEADLIPQICDWFSGQGFELRWLSDPGLGYGVGVHRLSGPRRKPQAGQRMFTFG
jgi:hypothetical protein